MVRRPWHIRGVNVIITLWSLCFWLSGCGDMAQLSSGQSASLFQMHNGQLTTLADDDRRVRGSLDVITTRTMPHIVYRGGIYCQYHNKSASLGLPPADGVATIRTASVDDEIFLFGVGADKRSGSELITKDGHIINFNIEEKGGERVNSENFTDVARRRLAELKATTNDSYTRRTGKTINSWSITIPEFRAGRNNVGETVAEVAASDGRVWAGFIYRGIIEYNGQEAVVLDLVTEIYDRANVLIGFNVVDIKSGLPFVSKYRAGSEAAMTQIACK